jgi:hypothetical protein
MPRADSSTSLCSCMYLCAKKQTSSNTLALLHCLYAEHTRVDSNRPRIHSHRRNLNELEAALLPTVYPKSLTKKNPVTKQKLRCSLHNIRGNRIYCSCPHLGEVDVEEERLLGVGHLDAVLLVPLHACRDRGRASRDANVVHGLRDLLHRRRLSQEPAEACRRGAEYS